jgi:hypothetical protein
MAPAGLRAQDAGPYQGVSTPPYEDSVITTPSAKPPASHPAAPAQNHSPYQSQPQIQSQIHSQPAYATTADPDSGIVGLASNTPAPEEPSLSPRNRPYDPDGDIVHPRPLRPGELPEGATIRVELLDQLSTSSSERGQAFRCRVASDVLQGGHVLIPAGAEIDGRIAEVSTGHAGGRGSMLLQPETVILANGARYRLHAYITGTPGSPTKVGSEGRILPASRIKRDSIEYGGAVGAGTVTGAIVGGPVGAVAGGIIGAGVISTHLIVSHPQATLEPGTVLLFTLTKPLQLSPDGNSGE